MKKVFAPGIALAFSLSTAYATGVSLGDTVDFTCTEESQAGAGTWGEWLVDATGRVKYPSLIPLVGGGSVYLGNRLYLYAPPVDYDGNVTIRWGYTGTPSETGVLLDAADVAACTASRRAGIECKQKYIAERPYGYEVLMSGPSGRKTLYSATGGGYENKEITLTGLAPGIYSFEAMAEHYCHAENPYCAAPVYYWADNQLAGNSDNSRYVTQVARAVTEVRTPDESVSVEDGVSVGTAPVIYAPPYDQDGNFEIVWANAARWIPRGTSENIIEAWNFKEYLLETSTSPTMTSPELLYVGTSPRFYVGGLPPGAHYFRVRSRYCGGSYCSQQFMVPYVGQNQTIVSPDQMIN